MADVEDEHDGDGHNLQEKALDPAGGAGIKISSVDGRNSDPDL